MGGPHNQLSNPEEELRASLSLLESSGSQGSKRLCSPTQGSCTCVSHWQPWEWACLSGSRTELGFKARSQERCSGNSSGLGRDALGCLWRGWKI